MEMAQEANNNEFSCGGGEVARGVERLLNDTNKDLKVFRDEQAQLRAQISTVVGENQRLTKELGKYKLSMESADSEGMVQRLQLTAEALKKALKQIEALRMERLNLQKMHNSSQRTIENMEMELKNYRAQLRYSGDDQLKEKYTESVKLLEEKVNTQQEELKTQAEMIKALHDHKQRNGEMLQKLQSKLKERAYDTVVMDENRNTITHLQKQIKEYEKSLEHTQNLLFESTKREVTAMQKVQDAINLSEAAVKEKENAEKRAETYKEECAQLATSIGSIMEDAAKCVDSEVAQLKVKLIEKDKALSSLRDKMRKEFSAHKEVLRVLEAQKNRLEQKSKELFRQNIKLANEVESTCARLNELERCASNSNGEDEVEGRQENNKKKCEAQLEKYLQDHKDMKSRYKAAVEDMTKEYESAIYKLKSANAQLLNENQILKSGAAGDCIRQP